jgi:[glutamine synthetase] adenylyltransferase / [glutamine synthetase]-adenylyl-L-tyrosine phosphorylase
MNAAKAKKRPSGKNLAAVLKPCLAAPGVAEVKDRLADLKEAAAAAGVGKALTALLKSNAALGPFLAAVMSYSPFLRSLIVDDPTRLVDFLSSDPAARLKKSLSATASSWKRAGEEEQMAALRRARGDVALLLALADLGGIWDVARVTKGLSDFADAAVGSAVRFILREASEAGHIDLENAAAPDIGSGWIVLGMGKFGAHELNYSSDIDLIVLYDMERARLGEDQEASRVFVRMTKRLVQILQEHTEDGYVFRTDLRLRPDPGATAIAMSTEAALLYYESLGQNWERAALIKARPVAGDTDAGDAFLRELTPYIWRKYLDYAAISDIHSIKRQIHDHRGHETIAVAGHNIKLGRGGIREIEFFVQTQQLIAGGRNAELRGRRTLEMLSALAATGWIDETTREEMSEAYVTLRAIEHRLQMIDDAQTHTLPEDDEELAVIAKLCCFADVEAFGKALRSTLTRVQNHYAILFDRAPSLTDALGNLSFTGDSDDPGTVATLSSLGFADPSEAIRTIRGWHFGRYPAMRSAAARERLTEILPTLLGALSGTHNSDAAFAAFDRFLARIPAGVQLFSILGSNPGLLTLLATIMGTAPRLAEIVIQRVHVLDALIEPTFFGSLPSREILEKRIDASFGEANSYEDVLDRARIFGQEQAFLIGVRVLAGTVDARQAGSAFADLADILVSRLLERVREEFEANHGTIRGGKMALVAMGKLGGHEMTAASDLDLIILYNIAKNANSSNGPRPLMAGQYFARLTQRLVAALSAPTAEGTLYEVDLRLRPSGNSGPVATHIDAFTTYQDKDAWTWEHMALTRARPLAGDKAFVALTKKEFASIISRRHSRKKVLADILEMRAMIESEKGGEGAWDLKQAPGGMIDIEFIAQYLQLVHAAKHPEIVSTETDVVLIAAAKAKLISSRDAEALLPALHLYQALTQILRLCVDGIFRREESPKGLLELLARAGDLPDFVRLDAHVKDTEAAVRTTFEQIIGPVQMKD